MYTPTRPVGPRTPGTAPLVIKKQRPTLPSLAPLEQQLDNLTIGCVPTRSRTPKPVIRLGIPNGTSHSREGDSPTYSYYGGPTGGPTGGGLTLDTNLDNHPDETTIQPNSSTYMPQTSKQHEPLKDIQAILSGLENRTTPASSTSQSDGDTWPAQMPALQFSNDVLEEVKRLGEGAGGAVHMVKDKRTGEVMARKTITTREAPMKQLLREIQIISSSAHHNIIRFHGAFISPSTTEVNILMEYCQGGSLEAVGKRIKERNAIVGEKIVGRLAEGILQGLAYLHAKKTIHRDIKPSNILLSKEGVVKLCDFGVSGELVESLAGTFTGTSFYMAPERISGHEYSIRSDVWSTGISLLELVQNRFPFPNDLPPIELMMHITTAEPPRLEDEAGIEWSDDMKDFIRQTLTISGQSRPTPGVMLQHPWILHVMTREANMGKWIRQVWGWESQRRNTPSRPPTARRESSGESRAHHDSPPQGS